MIFAMLIEPEQFSVSGAISSSLVNMLQTNAPFVGKIVGPRISGTCCLLDDGTVLTSLHLICDIKKANENHSSPRNYYDDKNSIYLYFVKDGVVYSYKINEIKFDGVRVIETDGMSAHSYDFAVLTLTENARHDIGRGFNLDNLMQTAHAFSIIPQKVVGISDPIFSFGNNNQIVGCKREIGIGESINNGNTYTIPQLSNLSTRSGLSGMAILPIGNPYPFPNSTLYAIHSGRNSLHEQAGVKISEYQSHVLSFQTPQVWLPFLPRPVSTRLDFMPDFLPAPQPNSNVVTFWQPEYLPRPVPQFLPPHFEYEGLTRNTTIKLQDVLEFLDSLNLAIYKNNPKLVRIPRSLLGARVMDGHFGTKHASISARPGSKFAPIIGGANSDILNALAQCVTEVAIEDYVANKHTYFYNYMERKGLWKDYSDPSSLQDTLEHEEANDYLYMHNKRRSTWFKFSENILPNLSDDVPRALTYVVDVGFNIGFDKDAYRDVSGILIEGLGSTHYHIYPKSTESVATSDTLKIIHVSDIVPRQNLYGH